MTFSRRIVQVANAGLVVGITACGTSDANPTQNPPPPPVADRLTVTLTPEQDSIALGTTRLFAAKVTNQYGVERSVPVDWASSNAAVATISPAGLATAVSGGSVLLIASISGHADTALVTVFGTEDLLQIVPDAISLLVGDDIQLETHMGDGVAGAGEAVVWTSSDSTLATIAADGTVSGHEAGLVTLTAQIGSATAQAKVVVEAASVATITITPAVNSIVAGATVDLQATARSSTGTILPNIHFTWTSSDTAIATVNGLGVVRGRARGFSIISASAQGKRGSVSVNVGPAPVARVIATLPDSSLLEGQVTQATATAYDANNRPITGATVAWQSSNPAIATVTSTGRVTALVAGSVSIVALSGGQTGSIPTSVASRAPSSVSITPATPSVMINGTAQLTGKVLDQNGQPITGPVIAWSVSNSSIAGISQTGLLTGKVQGVVNVTAASGTLATTVLATVGVVPVATVTISPGTASVTEGDSAAFVATTLDAQGVTLAGRVVTWTSSNPAAATIDAAGVASSIAAGSTTVTATAEGKSASVTLSVLPANALPIASITVTLNSTTLNAGQQTAAVAVTRNTVGAIVTAPISWTSSDPSIATVSVGGLVTAVTGGTTTIVGASGGVTGAASLTINAAPAAPVASIQVKLNPNALAVAGVSQANVTLFDADGNVLTGRTIGLSSDKPVVATVSSLGVVTAMGTGLTNIRAASGGKSGYALLTVSSLSTTVASVGVSAPATTLNVGGSLTAAAMAYDGSGNPVGGRSFTWASSAPSVISVSTSGVLSALSVGSASITATTGGVQGSLGFTALAASTNAVASVTLSLNASALNSGQTTQSVVVLKDSAGTTLTGRTVTYSSSSTAVATVSTAGLVTALSGGSATITATSGGVSGRASLSVTQVAVATVSVTVTPSTLNLGQTAGTTVTLRDAQGNVLSGRSITYSSNNTTVASVSTAGLVTALAVGTSGITAISGGVTGTASVAVQVSAPPASAANLPQSTPTIPAGLASLACTVNVPAGGLQSALTAARGGAVLCLTGTHIGNFTVPARTDAGWVVIRSAGTIPGGRMRPSLAGPLAKIVSNTVLSALTFNARSVRTLVVGVEITSTSSLTNGPVAIVSVGSGQDPTIADLPTDIAFERVYVHGWPAQHVRRAFSLQGGAQTVKDSWCSEIHASGFDSQCVISWNGKGPILIENNTLEAASENIMFGGADPKIPNMVASDITIRRNHINKPLTWMGAGWNVKNLIETKASRRVLVEENVIEGTWADGQVGYAFVLKSTSQNGGCRECSSSDWTIRRNLVRKVASGFSIAGRADQHITGATDSTNRRFDIAENWIEPLSVAPYTGDTRTVIFVADNQDMWVRRNVFESGGGVSVAMLFDTSSGLIACKNATVTDNVLPRGQYGLFTSSSGEGLASWTKGAIGTSVWNRNALIGSTAAVYPTVTTWHSSLASALATGAGVARGVIDAGVNGVVVSP